MKRLIQSLTVDLDRQQPREDVTVAFKQGDLQSGEIVLSLREDGRLRSVGPEQQLRLRLRKPLGAAVYANLPPSEDGKVHIPLTEAMLTQEGIARADVEIREGEALLSSFLFYLDIRARAVPDGAFEDRGEFGVLQDMIDRAQQAVDRVGGAVEEMDAALQATGEKLGQMDALAGALDGAEAARALAESGRQQNEALRSTQEAAREAAERARTQAESDRREQSRQAAAACGQAADQAVAAAVRAEAAAKRAEELELEQFPASVEALRQEMVQLDQSTGEMAAGLQSSFQDVRSRFDELETEMVDQLGQLRRQTEENTGETVLVKTRVLQLESRHTSDWNQTTLAVGALSAVHTRTVSGGIMDLECVRVGNAVQIYGFSTCNKIPDTAAWSWVTLLTLPEGYRPAAAVRLPFLGDVTQEVSREELHLSLSAGGELRMETRNTGISGWQSWAEGFLFWISASYVTGDPMPQ